MLRKPSHRGPIPLRPSGFCPHTPRARSPIHRISRIHRNPARKPTPFTSPSLKIRHRADSHHRPSASSASSQFPLRQHRRKAAAHDGEREISHSNGRFFRLFVIFIPAVLAGYSMGIDSTPEFGQGAAGYGRYFWHTAVDQTSENYMVEFIFPVVTHEDNRYYTLGRGGFFKRTGYALTRAVITRNDAGTRDFQYQRGCGRRRFGRTIEPLLSHPRTESRQHRQRMGHRCRNRWGIVRRQGILAGYQSLAVPSQRPH